MKYTASGLIFTLGIIDGVMFVFLSVNPRFIKEVLLIHLILYGIIYMLDDKYLYNHSGVPNYLALFLPGLGGVLVSLLHFSLLYFRRNSIVLGDFERYINFQRLFENQEKLDYDKEIQTLSFLDQMNLLDAKSKKQLIVDFGMNRNEDRVKLLHKGLLDMDGEVQHYSAVSLNMLENEYTHTINQLREEFNQNKDLDSLKRLTKVYQSYVESGLLSGEVLQVFNREYIDILRKLAERKKETPEIMNELVQAYIRGGDLIQAEAVNKRLLEKYHDRIEGILNQAHIAYEKNAYKELRHLLKNLKDRKLEVSPQLQTLLSYWLKNEEIQ